MSEHVLRINTKTGDVKIVATWPTGGSAGADAHYRRVAEDRPDVIYRTCPPYRVEQIREEFAQIAKGVLRGVEGI